MIQIENNGSRYTISQPLCGMDWIRQHLHDHTHAEIEALRIELSLDGRCLAMVKSSTTRGTVKSIVNLNKGG